MGALKNDGKDYYSLDVSKCSGVKWKRFSPLPGVEKVVKLILPDNTIVIEEQISATAPTFGLYTNLREISGAGVTAIGDYAFYNSDKLTMANFPNVESIGAYAFATDNYDDNGHKLANPSFPKVQILGREAFAYSRALQSITLPLCTTIGDFAFRGCGKLAALTAKPKILGENPFDACTKIIGGYNTPGVSTPEGLTGFDLSELAIVGHKAFTDWRDLTDIALPSVVTIGSYAFQGCISLETVSAKPKVLGSNIFETSYISSYATLPITEAETPVDVDLDLSALEVLNGSIFAGWPNLTSLELPAATMIADNALTDCPNLQTVNAPLVTTIGHQAFKNCPRLETVISAATSIGGDAFAKCPLLDALYVGAAPATQTASPKRVFVDSSDTDVEHYYTSATGITDGETFYNGNTVTLYAPDTAARDAWNAWLTDASAWKDGPDGDDFVDELSDNVAIEVGTPD
jgi:hypothetical protein